MYVISIHAPTRGATIYDSKPSLLDYISIHAPTRGATKQPGNTLPINNNFNPRSHERSDKYAVIHEIIPKISIHAPTRGATFRFFRHNIRHDNFNPRSHERSDSRLMQSLSFQVISIHAPTRGATIVCSCDSKPYGFQSTLPREERLVRFHLTPSCIAYFNPRSHERSD